MNTLSISFVESRQQDASRKLRLQGMFVAFCFLAIVFVSALDTWFAVANESILHVEKNPICAMLLKMEPQGCMYFVCGKATGTIICVGLIATMLRMRYRHANKVLACVALFQVCLLGYLVLSDPRMDGLPNLSLLFGDTPESIWRLR